MSSIPILLCLLLAVPLFIFLPRSPLIAPIVTYSLGLLTPFLAKALARKWQRDVLRRGEQTGLYGLDHAILNVELNSRPKTMWMNMGYWRDATALPEACEALVERILQTAGLCNDSRDKQTSTNRQNEGSSKIKRVLLDLGFGCGEQTLYLMNRGATNIPGVESTSGDDAPASLFPHYIGITLDRMQYEFAKSRVPAEFMQTEKGGGRNAAKTGSPNAKTVQLFCGDAANPSSWSEELQQAISIAFAPDASVNDDFHAPETERYVLALDSAYHFHPSRRNIMRHTHSVLNAHFLAFDIFLAPSSSGLRSFFNAFFLRFLTPALSAPFSNFVSPSAYKSQLKAAGYAEEDITIEDITEDVFPGLAAFLERRDQQLAALGLTGFSKWRISGWLFGWLAAGDILRAGIVVAKWKDRGRS